ncbi:hypothetical protein BD414DRAFT_275552 [Trametes punicea]|nr:hypothetical protein BD414DRAFT_275552 [Trametes punicea]
MFRQSYVVVMLYSSNEVWPMIATFTFSAGINIVMRGKTAVMDELEYWTFRSLSVCGLLSLYNTIGLAIRRLDLSWLAISFILGNLYTISDLLNVTESRSASLPSVLDGSRPSTLGSDSVRPPSAVTLTNDLWKHVLKAQVQATVPIPPLAMNATSVRTNDFSPPRNGLYEPLASRSRAMRRSAIWATVLQPVPCEATPSSPSDKRPRKPKVITRTSCGYLRGGDMYGAILATYSADLRRTFLSVQL